MCGHLPKVRGENLWAVFVCRKMESTHVDVHEGKNISLSRLP
jgi:hypothetical protein